MIRPRAARLAALIVACAMTSCMGYPTTGVIIGRLQSEEGGDARPIAGTVYITGENGSFTIEVPPLAEGAYYAEVPEESYVVTARSPRYESGERDCVMEKSSVRVLAAQTITVDVTCP